MLLFLVYTGFSLINLLAIKNIYWPALQLHIDGLQALQSLLDNWKLVIMAYMCIFITLFKQWWLKTAIKLDGGRYLLTHILNGKLVKIVVKPINVKINTVTDEDYNECYLDEAHPFLRFEQQEFCPEFLGVKRTLLLHLDGDLLPISVSPTSSKDD